MMAAFTLSQAYRQPEVFYVRFRECHFESGLAEVIYIDFGHSSTLDSFFSKTEVIYVSFSLYCKTRLFTFNFLNLQITQTLMAFPERRIMQYLTGCNLCRIVPMHF